MPVVRPPDGELPLPNSLWPQPQPYERVLTHTYPDLSTYQGPADLIVVEFSVPVPEQLSPVLRIFQSRASATILSTFEERGITPLAYELWRDATPTWSTRYRLVVLAHGSPIPQAILLAAIGVALAILFVQFALRPVLVGFRELLWGPTPPSGPGEPGVPGTPGTPPLLSGITGLAVVALLFIAVLAWRRR